MRSHKASIHWFRKGLRLHDNPALSHAVSCSESVFPVFVMDPWFANEDLVGIRRYKFLLESLGDLDRSLRAKNSRLYIARGKPEDVLPELFERFGATLLTFEKDTEPYARKRDTSMISFAECNGIEVVPFTSHTLFDPSHLFDLNKKKSTTSYSSFCKLVGQLKVPTPIDTPCKIPRGPIVEKHINDAAYDVPSLVEMGYNEELLNIPCPPAHVYPGGESVGVARMHKYLGQKRYIAEFEKPKTSPNSLNPSTTVLSPYLKFGCVSPRVFYHALLQVYKDVKKHTHPPVSLVGQLLWREFFYFNGFAVPNYDRMIGNPICKQIDWVDNEAYLNAWEMGRTGYPYIDAIMNQLRSEGWIHHLARHSAACFLTRGDLFVSWERGAKVFDKYLLDADWSLNNGNWMWLSASAFFYQYFRVYGPVSFGKKTDKEGEYIRKYVPVLRNMPRKYIYEPWNAPMAVQENAGCIVGKDYPLPIVDHKIASKQNMQWMSEGYKRSKLAKGAASKPTKKATQGSGGNKKRKSAPGKSDIRGHFAQKKQK
eukprot:g7315.t1